MKNFSTTYILFFIILNLNLNAQCYTDVKVGESHIIAKKADGTLWAWGRGIWGVLGSGDDSDNYLQNQMLAGTNFNKIAAGKVSNFAIKQNGTLWGSGGNDYGALGINSTDILSLNLVQIGTANNWKEISTDSSVTIGLKTDNTIWGWGQNNVYQMGDGTCCNDRYAPAQIGTGNNWKTIATSEVSSSFGIKNDGTLWAWGSNIAGLLGDNLTTVFMTPTLRTTGNDWSSIVCGAGHALAIKNNGTLWSWGNYSRGATGNDGFRCAYYDPYLVSSDAWLTVAAGYDTSFGIKTDGTLWAWGWNDVGQLGIGNYVNQFSPVQIGTDNNWAVVSARYQTAAAIKTDGSLWVWGSNRFGQLGNGTATGDSTGSIVPVYLPAAGCTLANNQFFTSGNKFSIAPNPSKTVTAISYDYTLAPAIEVYSMLGQRVANYLTDAPKGTWNFETAGLLAGIYVVVLKDKDQIIVQQKLIIE